MLREPMETYSHNNFDQDGHITFFLQISAMYLEGDTDHVSALFNKPWLAIPAGISQEAQHA